MGCCSNAGEVKWELEVNGGGCGHTVATTADDVVGGSTLACAEAPLTAVIAVAATPAAILRVGNEEKDRGDVCRR